MSSLAEIRSLVAEERRRNSALRQELYKLESGISGADNDWGQLCNYINNTLINGENRVTSSHERTVQSYELQCEIEIMYKLYKNIELANKKIRACKNKIYYEFANYRAVRKIVQAMLSNIEVSFVSDATITKAVEIQHLQIPDYWLTCALLSIMAWRNDDKELADRALARAYKLDKKNTSMFFFAFHIRIGKDSVALKWFQSYISCARTGEDAENIMLMFSIINKCLVEDCDAEIISKVNSFVNQIIKDDIAREGYNEDELVERIRSYLGAYRANDAIDYPMLANYTKNIGFLKDEMMAAKSNINILDFILKTVNGVTAEEKNHFLSEYIDNLIAKSNSSERDVTNEIKYNEMVIANGGRVDEAKAQYDEWLKHNETELMIVSEMVDWVYEQNADGMNPTIRLMMFKLIKGLTREAIRRNVEKYRSRFTRNLDIKINDYETNANLKDVAGESSKIDAFFKEKADGLLAQEKVWPCAIWFGVGALCIVGAIALSAPALFVGTGIGALGGALKILFTSKNKKRIAESCAAEAVAVKDTFASLSGEFAKYEKEYTEYDSYYERIEEEFEKL